MAIMAGDAVSAARAATAPPVVAFRIPPGTLSANLVRFAVQSNISLGLDAVDACVGTAPGLLGLYTVEAGLQRILSGTGCGYRALDARAYVIEPLPRSFASVMAAPADNPASVEVAELVVTAQHPSTPGDLGGWGGLDLATAVSNVLGGVIGGGVGSRPAAACEDCSGSEPVVIVGAAPVRQPPAGSDSPAGVPEPGTWATMLLGLAALGTSLRRRRDHIVKKTASDLDLAPPDRSRLYAPGGARIANTGPSIQSLARPPR
jgi:hypothetical protein